MGSQTTRRNGSSKSSKSSTAYTTELSTIRSSAARTKKLLPNTPELLIIIIYPSILLIGSLFSILDPTVRSTPYSTLLQSYPPDLAPSYFARKSNIFNLYFVKIGWAWTTLAFFLFLFSHPLTGPRNAIVLTPRRLQALTRYGLATVWWTIITQWFFGPALIDRAFRWTGGQCKLVWTRDADGVRDIMTATACRIMGGQWMGGYDISGHVFLLVLGSAFLMFEAMPVILGRTTSKEELHVAGDGDDWEGGISVGILLGVTAMCWWMLLMTAIYFHTWFEKVCSSKTPSVSLFSHHGPKCTLNKGALLWLG